MLELVSDFSPAQWLGDEAEACLEFPDDNLWFRSTILGPRGYNKYARLLFIPDPVSEGLSENEGGRFTDFELGEREQLEFAVGDMLPYTNTPDDGYIAIWDGWGSSLAPALEAKPKFDIPDRAYFVFRADLRKFASGDVNKYWMSQADILAERVLFEGGYEYIHHMPVPAFIWPADRAWCIANDVDPHYAGIGGSAEAIAAVLSDSRLHAKPQKWEAQIPHYGI